MGLNKASEQIKGTASPTQEQTRLAYKRADAARQLSIGRTKLWELMKAGKIKAGPNNKITHAELQRYLKTEEAQLRELVRPLRPPRVPRSEYRPVTD